MTVIGNPRSLQDQADVDVDDYNTADAENDHRSFSMSRSASPRSRSETKLNRQQNNIHRSLVSLSNIKLYSQSFKLSRREGKRLPADFGNEHKPEVRELYGTHEGTHEAPKRIKSQSTRHSTTTTRSTTRSTTHPTNGYAMAQLPHG
jgi:hypothetical protein